MTDKPQMTPEQEAKLAKALEILRNANNRMEETSKLIDQFLAEQENCSSKSAT